MGTVDNRVGRSWVARLARVQPWYLLTKYPNRLTRSIFAFVNACLSIGVMAAVAVYTRQPLVFPSLGPSAFLFFHRPSAVTSSPRNAILGHGAAILIGWLSFTLFGKQTPVAEIASVAVSLGLISALMIAANIPHPPAASTTAIVSLGLMTEGRHLVALMVGVILLTALAFVINRLSGVSYPLWKARPGYDKEGLVATALRTEAPPARGDVYADLADRLAARKNVIPPKKRK